MVTEKEAREALFETLEDALREHRDNRDSYDFRTSEEAANDPEIISAIDALLAARTESIVEYVRKYAANCAKWPSDMRAIQDVADRVELYFVPPSVDSETLTAPDEIDVDGIEDDNGIRYFGKARRQPDGTHSCLADVHGRLALVAVRITVTPTTTPQGSE